MSEHLMPDPQIPSPEETRPVCGVTLTMAPSGAGVQITMANPGTGQVQRVATMLDLRAMCTEVLHLLQAQMTVQQLANFEAQQEAARMAQKEAAAQLGKANGKRRGGLVLPWQGR